ncbi:MAG: hypothetical protein ACEQSB_08005, partial [Undibacterium sp.]
GLCARARASNVESGLWPDSRLLERVSSGRFPSEGRKSSTRGVFIFHQRNSETIFSPRVTFTLLRPGSGNVNEGLKMVEGS